MTSAKIQLTKWSFRFSRSQISICSEPSNIPLYQLSVDQSFPEENLKVEERSTEIEILAQLHEEVGSSSTEATVAAALLPQRNNEIDTIVEVAAIKRPNSLMLNCNRNEFDNNSISGGLQLSKRRKHHRYLYRSNSSSLHKRPTTLVPIASAASNTKYKLSSELDQIYFISSNKDDDNYDSIEVIDERRMKNLPKSEKARLYKSNTFICEEYYSSASAPVPASAESQATDDNEQMTTTSALIETSARDDTAAAVEAADESNVQMTATIVDNVDKQSEKQ